MKKFKKIIELCICAALLLTVSACNSSNENTKGNEKENSKVTTYSNMASRESSDEVETLLSHSLIRTA